MKRFSYFVTNHPWLIVIVAFALLIPAGTAALRTPINYDLLSYMPREVESIEGQMILQEDFKIADTAYVMVDTDKTAAVIGIKEKLEKIDGVASVVWLSDVVDPAISYDFVPAQLKEAYTKDGHSMLHLTFAEAGASAKTIAAVAAIDSLLAGDLAERDVAFIGMPVILNEMNKLVDQESVRSIIAAAILSILVISIAMGSLLVPFLVLGAIGISIGYNMGTNFVLGTISYLSGGIAAAIQLGVTLDFSIFLLHRFYEECHTIHAEDELSKYDIEDVRAAMQRTINGTFSAILPSALTTMAGFLALSFMQMGFGKDMGMVMAKGVFWGMLTTITVLPALLIICRRFLKVRAVRRRNQTYRRIAGFVTRHAGVLALVFVISFFPLYYAKTHTNISYNINEMMPDTMPAVQSIEKVKSVMGSIEVAYILYPEDAPRYRVMPAFEEIGKLAGVTQVVSLDNLGDPALPRSFIPAGAREGFVRNGRAMAILRLSVESGTARANALTDEIRAVLDKHEVGPYHLAGATPATKDMTEISKSDISRVEMASIVSIFLIIALTFLSPSIPLVLVAGIELAIFSNLAVPYFLGAPIPHVTVTSISAIQLGCTVDYAILLMSRYRANRRRLCPKAAMEEALTHSMPAILAAGCSLAAATFGIALVSDLGTAKSLTAMIGRGAVISMLTIMIFLPAVIVKIDKVFKYSSYGWRKNVCKE